MTEKGSKRNRTGKHGEKGYTLLELLIVIAILGLIVALAAPQVVGYLGRSKTRAAEIQISSLQSAIELYRLDIGAYPTSDQGLQALIIAPKDVKGWHGPYLDRDDGIIDPWGHPYIYEPPGPSGRMTLRSLGADGKPGGSGDDQDISNRH